MGILTRLGPARRGHKKLGEDGDTEPEQRDKGPGQELPCAPSEGG